MAGTVTTLNSDNRAIERDPTMLVFEYEAEAAATPSEEATLRALPAGTTILKAETHCIIADSGATSTKLSLKIGSNTILAGSTDNGGTQGTVDDGVTNGTFAPHLADDISAANLIADFDQVGSTAAGTAPKWRIVVWAFRKSF